MQRGQVRERRWRGGTKPVPLLPDPASAGAEEEEVELAFGVHSGSAVSLLDCCGGTGETVQLNEAVCADGTDGCEFDRWPIKAL